MTQIIIDKSNYGKRVDKFIFSLMPEGGKSFFYKMFRKKNITLNGKKISGSEILKVGDEIKIFFSDETYNKLRGEEKTYTYSLPKVVFEDENILVINKDKGVFSQVKKGKISVLDQIYSHYKLNGYEIPNGFKIGTSNRLDAETTGVIISGKTTKAVRDINLLIKNHKVKKKYIALVKGSIGKEILLENKMTKSDGKAIISEQGKIAKMKLIPKISKSGYTLVEVELETGRYHQIRLSMADLGHPIIGDKKYGDKEANENFKKAYGITSQMLHSHKYEFMGDICGKKYGEFKADQPEEFLKIVEKMEMTDGLL